MASQLNRWQGIGRLCADPEYRTFSNGGAVANVRFAVNNSKKDDQGNWVDDPVFIDLKGFNRQNGRKLADTIRDYMHKGDLVYFEGRLVLEKWQNQDGENRQKIVCYIDDFNFCQSKNKNQQGQQQGGYQQPQQNYAPPPQQGYQQPPQGYAPPPQQNYAPPPQQGGYQQPPPQAPPQQVPQQPQQQNFPQADPSDEDIPF